MQPPELIERAKNARHLKESELAAALGVPFQHVNDWKRGTRTCPPDMRARLARLCGLDPRAELAEAVAEGLNDQRRAGLLEALADAEVSRHWWNFRQAPPGIRVCLLTGKGALQKAIDRLKPLCSQGAAPSQTASAQRSAAPAPVHG